MNKFNKQIIEENAKGIRFMYFCCCSFFRKSVHDGQTSLLSRVVDDIKASPQGSGSPATAHTTQPSPQDRAAAKRAELRRIEQERRRREAVCVIILFYK